MNLDKYDKLKERLKGVAVVMVTPFKENYELDEEGLRKLTRFLIESGIKNGNGVLIPAGSTGECPMLSEEEWVKVFKIVKEEAGDSVPIIGGCNHTDPRMVIKLARHAEEIGLDGVMICPPYYWKANEQIVQTFYKTVAKEINLGIMIYNNWLVSQIDIPINVLVSLVDEIPQIVALKDNTQYLEKFSKTVDLLGDKIAVFNGLGEPHEPYAAKIGGEAGFLSAASCVIPKTLLKVYESERKEDFETAKEILKKASPLIDFLLGGEPGISYISRIKAAMNIIGLQGGVPRLPLLPVDEKTKEQLEKLLSSYEFPEIWNK